MINLEDKGPDQFKPVHIDTKIPPAKISPPTTPRPKPKVIYEIPGNSDQVEVLEPIKRTYSAKRPIHLHMQPHRPQPPHPVPQFLAKQEHQDLDKDKKVGLKTSLLLGHLHEVQALKDEAKDESTPSET